MSIKNSPTFDTPCKLDDFREGASDVEMRHTEEYRLMTENIELRVEEERAKLALDRLTRCSVGEH